MTQTEKSVIRRVLLVDDDEAVRAMMSATLESKGAGGTDVQVAAQLPKSFSHASDSDTGIEVAFREVCPYLDPRLPRKPDRQKQQCEYSPLGFLNGDEYS